MIQLIGQVGPQRIRHQRPIAGGRDPHQINGIEGALGGGVKLPQLLEVFTEELQSHRQLSADRKQINDVAAAAPAALLLNGGDPLVAQAGEAGGQFLQVDAGAFAQGEALVSQHRRWWQVGLQGPLSGHDHPLPAFALLIHQFAEHLQLAPGDLAGGIKGFVRRALAGGIKLRGGPAHQLQQGRPAAGLFQGGHHHQQRSALAAGHGGGQQRPGPATGPLQAQAIRAA